MREKSLHLGTRVHAQVAIVAVATGCVDVVVAVGCELGGWECALTPLHIASCRREGEHSERLLAFVDACHVCMGM